MSYNQNDIEYLIDMVQRGVMTADQANVEKVRMQRVHLVTCRLTSDVRKSLNEAVKRGELMHIKKEGHKPEVYFHPEFDYMARSKRNEHARSTVSSLGRVIC